MSTFQHGDCLGNFQNPSHLYDIEPPEQIAFYSYFVNNINDYRFNDHSALRRYKYEELSLPLQLDTAANREEFRDTSARLDQVPRPSLAPVITACVGSGRIASLYNANVITRRDVLSSLGTGEDMTFAVVFMNGKLHIDKKNTVPNSDVSNDGPYFGHCFEEVCTTPNTLERNGQFYSIVSRRLGNLNIVMAGEVDCADGGYPRLENYRELKTQRARNHRNWPKWYLQSFILGVPTLVLGNRSKRNLLTGMQTMSMQQLLATTVSHSPDFDRASALGRIHGVLSALIEYCWTRAGYQYTGCFTCELQIRSQGGAFVLSVPPDNGVTTELLLAWSRTRGVDVLGGGLIHLPPPPLAPGPQHHLPSMWITGPYPFRPWDPSTSTLFWVIVFPFAVYCAFSIYDKLYLNVLPIATMIFQYVFFFYFVAFSLSLPIMLCAHCAAYLFPY